MGLDRVEGPDVKVAGQAGAIEDGPQVLIEQLGVVAGGGVDAVAARPQGGGQTPADEAAGADDGEAAHADPRSPMRRTGAPA